MMWSKYYTIGVRAHAVRVSLPHKSPAQTSSITINKSLVVAIVAKKWRLRNQNLRTMNLSRSQNDQRIEVGRPFYSKQKIRRHYMHVMKWIRIIHTLIDTDSGGISFLLNPIHTMTTFDFIWHITSPPLPKNTAAYVTNSFVYQSSLCYFFFASRKASNASWLFRPITTIRGLDAATRVVSGTPFWFPFFFEVNVVRNCSATPGVRPACVDWFCEGRGEVRDLLWGCRLLTTHYWNREVGK